FLPKSLFTLVTDKSL
nr:RecName: Full=Cytokinin dehydrogenase; AltName: Full=Cytokinin oxidase; Short=CKO; Short=CKX [Triticum aestivum]